MEEGAKICWVCDGGGECIGGFGSFKYEWAYFSEFFFVFLCSVQMFFLNVCAICNSNPFRKYKFSAVHPHIFFHFFTRIRGILTFFLFCFFLYQPIVICTYDDDIFFFRGTLSLLCVSYQYCSDGKLVENIEKKEERNRDSNIKKMFIKNSPTQRLFTYIWEYVSLNMISIFIFFLAMVFLANLCNIGRYTNS